MMETNMRNKNYVKCCLHFSFQEAFQKLVVSTSFAVKNPCSVKKKASQFSGCIWSEKNLR